MRISSLIVLTLCSCTTAMKVRVDIFDRAALVNSKEYNLVSRSEINYSCVEFEKKRYLIKENAVQLIEIAIKDSFSVAEGEKKKLVIDVSNKDLLSNSFADSVIVEVRCQACKEGQLDKTKAFLIYESRLKILFESIVNNTSPRASQVVQNLLTSNTDVLNSKRQFSNLLDAVYGKSIVDDPLASFVVKAPEEYWSKYPSKFDMLNFNPGQRQPKSKKPARINNTVVRTIFGNADIAIKMEAPGYFVVKGVRLDANEAFKASFKVLNQGLKYISYTAGITVPAPGTPAGNTTNYVAKIPELVENDTLSLSMQNGEEFFQKQARSFLSQVLATKNKIEGAGATDVTAQNALKDIKLAYESFINSVK